MAIPKLEGPAQGQTRDALMERLAHMTDATLHDKLQDADAEIRRAAARACAMRDERAHVPDLIRLLEDPDASVGRAAHTALKALTRQDFGPSKDAGRAERAKAVADWNAWWQKQSSKRGQTLLPATPQCRRDEPLPSLPAEHSQEAKRTSPVPGRPASQPTEGDPSKVRWTTHHLCASYTKSGIAFPCSVSSSK
jgi:hypothetical protein